MKRNRSCWLIAAAVATAIAGVGHAQCGPSEALCSEPHPEPGCLDPDCCAEVCKDYVHCCEITWDQECVDLAFDVCSWIACGSGGACTEARDTPGCDELSCCKFVCRLDAYCCTYSWDAFCVDEGARLCPTPQCAVEIPAEAIDENEHCYDRINDGCSFPDAPMVDVALPTLRSGKHSSGSPRDTDWYRFTVASGTRVRLELTAEFPGLLVVTQGPCLGPIVEIAEASAIPCQSAIIDRCLEAGTYACLVSAGDDNRIYRNAFTCDEIDPKNPPDPKDPVPPPSPYGLRYVLRMESLPCLLGDIDGDGVVGQTDLAILLGAWGSADELADLDGDGFVGSTDLAILLGAWSG